MFSITNINPSTKENIQPISMDSIPNTTHVFLNPNFKNTHINPNFLKLQAAGTIHINPMFLDKLKELETVDSHQGKIIAKSRTKLIRESRSTYRVPQLQPNLIGHSPLIKIGARKLVRASLVKAESKSVLVVREKPFVPPSKGRYKIDRRGSKSQVKKLDLRKHFVSKYALSRVGGIESLTPKKVTVTNRRTCRMEKTLSKGGLLLNINGVLYKSTKTKLQKTVGSHRQLYRPTKQIPNKPSNGERVLFVRGNKFVLDKTGHNLTRVQTEITDRMRLKRIDIGGLTYVANSQNTLIRTDIHRARNHLSSAKHKSINLLSSLLVKSNVPCPIFRKVGKCAAFERGKCPKVHDKKQVAICPRFLKGECISDNCILSHDVTLSKMPTCKFFLQGCCVRSECPYLHKKLNVKTEICLDFLKGFCNLAEKCNKRHEFLCPDFERKGKCERLRCLHVHRKETFNKIIIKNSSKVSNTKTVQSASTLSNRNNKLEEELIGKLNARYFREVKSTKLNSVDTESTLESDSGEMESSDSTSNSNDGEAEIEADTLRKRHKLGELPAFIPL